MLSQKKELYSLVKTLIDSTCTYTAMHISNDKNRYAYVRAVSRCLNLCMSSPNRNNTERMRKELVKLYRETPKTFAPRLELFSNTKKYYMLGIQQSLAVVESINTRFEKGYSYADEWFVRSILGSINHED